MLYIASGSSPIKIRYFILTHRINEVYDFSIKYHFSDILLKKIVCCVAITLVIVFAWFL